MIAAIGWGVGAIVMTGLLGWCLMHVASLADDAEDSRGEW